MPQGSAEGLPRTPRTPRVPQVSDGHGPLPRRHEAVTTASLAPRTAQGLGVVGEMETGTGHQCHYQTRAQSCLPSYTLARLGSAVCF